MGLLAETPSKLHRRKKDSEKSKCGGAKTVGLAFEVFAKAPVTTKSLCKHCFPGKLLSEIVVKE